MILYFTMVLLLTNISFIPYLQKFKFLNKISLVLIIPFLIFNTDNPDFYAYNRMFMFDDPDGLAEIGFKFLIKAVKFFGGDSYRIILIILGILLFITLSRYSKYTRCFNYIVLLYFIFPFTLDVIQIRNTFMFLFILNAILDYAKNKKLKCLLFLIIAATFQNIGFVYIVIFVLFEFFKRKMIVSEKNLEIISINYTKNRIFYNIIVFLGVINILFGKHLLLFIINNFPVSMVRAKLPVYMTTSLNMDSIVGWSGLLIIDLIIFYKIIKRKRSKLELYGDMRIVNTLYFFLFSGVMLMGSLLYIYEVVNRIFRGLFLVKYLLYGCIDKSLAKDEKILMRTYLISTSALISAIYYLKGLEYDFLLENLIFKNVAYFFIYLLMVVAIYFESVMPPIQGHKVEP